MPKFLFFNYNDFKSQWRPISASFPPCYHQFNEHKFSFFKWIISSRSYNLKVVILRKIWSNQFQNFFSCAQCLNLRKKVKRFNFTPNNIGSLHTQITKIWTKLHRVVRCLYIQFHTCTFTISIFEYDNQPKLSRIRFRKHYTLPHLPHILVFLEMAHNLEMV